MVLQRAIENLRERPHDERRAVALSISIGVMAVLFLGWSVFFFRSQNLTYVQAAPAAYNDAVANVQQAFDQSQMGWESKATTEVRTQPLIPADEAALDPNSVQFIEDTSATAGTESEI